MAAVLLLRRDPELRFLEDETRAKANRIEEILQGLDVGRSEDHGDGDPEDGGTLDPADDATEELGDG